MAFDRSSSGGPQRDRRQWQKLSAGVGGVIYGNGLTFDTGSSTLSVDLGTAGGLHFTGTSIAILLDPVADNMASLSAAGLNVQSPLTTKGDVFTWDTGNQRLGVGTDGQVLTADSTQPTGLKWGPAGSFTSPLTTKGDLLGFSTVNARVPVGSNTQVLTADSGQPLGVKWATPTVFTSPLSTKGDLFTWDSANQRLPVGSNGQVLTADPTQSTGLKWGTPFTGVSAGADFPLYTLLAGGA